MMDGFLVAAYFNSSTIKVEDQIVSNHCNTNAYTSDILIVKYNSNGELEWLDIIGNSSGESLSNITETKDGGYLITGSFNRWKWKIYCYR